MRDAPKTVETPEDLEDLKAYYRRRKAEQAAEEALAASLRKRHELLSAVHRKMKASEVGDQRRLLKGAR